MSKSQIRNLTELYSKDALLSLCEKHLDPNTCKKSWNKTKLAEALVKGGYGPGGSAPKPSKPSKPSKPKPPSRPGADSDLACGMDHKACMKTKGKGGWTVQEIRNLAIQCGVDPAGKTRDQLCAEIALSAARGGQPSRPDTPDTPDTPVKPPKKTKPLPEIPPYRPGKGRVGPPEEPIRPPVQPPAVKPAAPTIGGMVVNPDVIKAIDEALDNNTKIGTDNATKAKYRDIIVKIMSGFAEEIADSDLEEEDLPTNKRLLKLGLSQELDREVLYEEVYEAIKGFELFVPGSEPGTPEPSDDECGGHFEEYMKMSPIKLRNALREKGIVNNVPVGRGSQVDYLCAMAQNGRCDPENGLECESGFVCDASNNPGVCLTEEQADARKLEEFIMPNGRRVIGTAAALEVLKKKLTEHVTEHPTPSPAPETPIEPSPETPVSPVEPAPETPTEPSPETPVSPAEPTPESPQLTPNRAAIMELLDSRLGDGLLTQEGYDKYVAALRTNGHCDPEKGVMCNGELVCDLTTKVCIDEDFASVRRQRLRSTEINGKKYIGSPMAIKKLEKALGMDKQMQKDDAILTLLDDDSATNPRACLVHQIADYYKKFYTSKGASIKDTSSEYFQSVRRLYDALKHLVPESGDFPALTENDLPYDGDLERYTAVDGGALSTMNRRKLMSILEPCKTEAPILPGVPTPITPVEPAAPTPKPAAPTPKPPVAKPPEGTEVPDIEDILRRLQAGDAGNITDLAECQRVVLKCLALTA